MRSLFFFIALAICFKLEAQNDFINNRQQKYRSSTEKINIVTANEDSPLAHPAKKDFPYDFELAGKDPNYNVETSLETEGAPEVIYAALTNSEDFPLAHTVRKEFPYDFELLSKESQQVFEMISEKESFSPLWQPTFEEIQRVISQNNIVAVKSLIVRFGIKTKVPQRNFLSY